MKVAVMAGFSAEGDVDVNASHAMKMIIIVSGRWQI
jgi:hypothetical protein